MNTKQGYVYILINPSLKGLLKVGQTKKDPEERAREILLQAEKRSRILLSEAATRSSSRLAG